MAHASRSASLHHFSFNVGQIHWVVLNTNAYLHHQIYWLLSIQHEWLRNDLERVNRSATPWIFVSCHRSLYCVKNDDNECNSEMLALRYGIPEFAYENRINTVDTPPGDTEPRLFSLEQLFDEYAVDVVFNGHTHHYERSWPVSKGVVQQKDFMKPQAPVYVVAGIAGNQGVDEFANPPANFTAYRDESYTISWGHVTVFNATHMAYQQRSAIDGSVFDEFTIVKVRAHLFFIAPRSFTLLPSLACAVVQLLCFAGCACAPLTISIRPI